MGGLKGKTCLVTAAAQRIGRAPALAMRAEGTSEIVTDVNEIALQKLSTDNLRRVLLDVRYQGSIADGVDGRKSRGEN